MVMARLVACGMHAQLLCLLVIGSVFRAGRSTYYTMVNPNVRTGTRTRRCGINELASPGQWRCSDVKLTSGTTTTAYKLCNTFELKDPHTCHYHQFTQAEIGQCMASGAKNLVIFGQSNAFNLMTTIYSWFNRADASTFDVFDWLDDAANDNHRILGCANKDWTKMVAVEIHLDSNGQVKWKGGVAQPRKVNDMYDFAALKDKSTTTTGIVTNIRATKEVDMLDGLNGLVYAGRGAKTGYLMFQVGSYFTDTTAFRSAMVKVIEKVKSSLPKYMIILVGYAAAGNVVHNDVMKELVSTYGAKSGYPVIKYLNVYDMIRAPNAPLQIDGHYVKVHDHAIFQRVFSVMCATSGATEDEQMVVGSSNCQYVAGLTFDTQNKRQCNMMAYSSNTAPFPSPPAAVGLSPQATPLQKCTDADKDGYSVCGGDCDDTNAAIKPCVAEVCRDGKDNNCDGKIDETSCTTVASATCVAKYGACTGGKVCCAGSACKYSSATYSQCL